MHLVTIDIESVFILWGLILKFNLTTNTQRSIPCQKAESQSFMQKTEEDNINMIN